MIRSMTGFGRAHFELAGHTFDVEVRTVNHRHLDVRVRLPRQMGDHERGVKSLVQERLRRGKVDLTVALASGDSLEGALEIDHALAGQYVEAARSLGAAHGLTSALEVQALLGMPGVTRFVDEGLPEADLVAALTGGVTAALDAAAAMRLEEGRALAAEFEGRLDRVLGLVDYFETRGQEVVEAAKERLHKRIEQLREETGVLDEARLHHEIVLAADRLDITEELVRLRSHVAQFRALLAEGEAADQAGEPVGRRLDFLLQEMGREANTIGSKANDAPQAHQVVELKSELERIREQAQNVE